MPLLFDGMVWNAYSPTVDINGFKGPNKYGRDQFSFYIITNQYYNRYGIPQGTVVPFGSKLYADLNWDNFYWETNNNCTTENANKGDWKAAYCTGRVLEEDAMNY